MNDRDEAHAGFLLDGRYRLLAPNGSGGMAVVWRAHDDLLDRTVAIKMLAARHLGDQESRDRIRHEARAAAAFAHPNIAQVYDYGEMVTEEGVFPYVVMEFVPGGTLLSRLREGPLSAPEAMRVCSEIAAGLDAAHTRGLVHRDIKPANVILAPTGAKVVDFGIAAAAAPGRPTHEDFVVVGTPTYLAPERLVDDVVVAASDVYSLGILLYRLLAGRSPWDQEQTTRMLIAHVHLPPAPLPPVPGVPEDVVELCHRCLDKDPEKRPVAREVAEVLAKAGAAPALPAGPRKTRLRWVTAAIAIAAVTAAAGISWTLSPGDRTEAGPASAEFSSSSPWASPKPPRSAAPSPTGGTPVAQVVTTVETQSVEALPPTPTPAATTTAAAAAQPSPSSGPSGTSAPATTPPPARVVERTFSSEAGSIRATCPTPGSAQILASSAVKPYRIHASEPGPGAAAFVIFQRGKTQLTMTVTCDGNEPAVTSTTN